MKRNFLTSQLSNNDFKVLYRFPICHAILPETSITNVALSAFNGRPNKVGAGDGVGLGGAGDGVGLGGAGVGIGLGFLESSSESFLFSDFNDLTIA